jgi:hypothetical protein
MWTWTEGRQTRPWLVAGCSLVLAGVVTACSCEPPREEYNPPDAPLPALVSFTMVNPRDISGNPPDAWIGPRAAFEATTAAVIKGEGDGVGQGSGRYEGTDCASPPCSRLWGEGTLTIQPRVMGVGQIYSGLSGYWSMTAKEGAQAPPSWANRSEFTYTFSGTMTGTFGDRDSRGNPTSLVVDYVGTMTMTGYQETSTGKQEVNDEGTASFKVRYDVVDWVVENP